MKFASLKIETYIPEEYVNNLQEELNKIGALKIGDTYDYCMTVSKVKGYYRPLKGANPSNGKIDKISEVHEMKVEFICEAELCKLAVLTIKAIHPYEKPITNILPIISVDDLE